MRTRVALAVAGVMLTGAQAGAQLSREVQLEARADFIDARSTLVQGAVGLTIPASTYTRLTLLAAAGGSWRDGRSGTSARLDATARFVLDPLRAQRWSAYGGGGVSALYDDRDEWRPLIMFFAGLEGPAGRGVVPALEVGLGGGLRVGVALRKARREGR